MNLNFIKPLYDNSLNTYKNIYIVGQEVTLIVLDLYIKVLEVTLILLDLYILVLDVTLILLALSIVFYCL